MGGSVNTVDDVIRSFKDRDPSTLKTISTRVIQDAEWNQIYFYQSPNVQFSTLASSTIPGLTIMYVKRKGCKTKSEYSVLGQKTDSVIQAIRWYNAEVTKRKVEAAGGRQEVAGSPEQVKSRRVQPNSIGR